MNLNIQGVNYTPSVADVNSSAGMGNSTGGQTITQTPDGQININVPGGLTSAEAGVALLQKLNMGDVFTGEITNITQNQITLALSDSVTVSATLADALSYNIGDTASFAIKDNSGEQIILKSVNTENLKNLKNDQTIRSALGNAGLVVNDTTVSLVHNLMKQGLPIDSDTLNEYSRMLAAVPNATPEDVVFLTRIDIPVTDENIAALHDYYDFTSGMTQQAEDISKGALEFITGLSSEHPELNTTPEQVGSNIIQLVSSFGPQVTVPENINAAMPQEALDRLAGQLVELAGTDEEGMPVPDGTLNQLAAKVSEGNITAKELLMELGTMLTEHPVEHEKLGKLLGGREFEQLTQNMVRQELFIPPQDINRQNIRHMYAKIINDSESIAQKLGGNDRAAGLVGGMEHIKQDVMLLNNINHFMNYVQLPIKMSGQNAHGDLYVYNNRRRGSDKEDMTAFLHLDMDNLGPMDIYVKLDNRNVTTNFKVATEEILDYIEANMELLTARLNKLGYNVNSTAAISEEKYSFKHNVIESELPPKEIKRFSFDVRA